MSAGDGTYWIVGFRWSDLSFSTVEASEEDVLDRVFRFVRFGFLYHRCRLLTDMAELWHEGLHPRRV